MPKREVEDFIAHWSAASPSERANSQPFLLELCDLLDVPRPDPHPANGYFFEFPVTEQHPDSCSPIWNGFLIEIVNNDKGLMRL